MEKHGNEWKFYSQTSSGNIKKYLTGELGFGDFIDELDLGKSSEEDEAEEENEKQAVAETKQRQTSSRPTKASGKYRDLEARLGEAYLLWARGSSAEAIKRCMDLIKEDPDWYGAYQTLGCIYEEQENFDSAIQFQMIACLQRKTDEDGWIKLYELCTECEKNREALTCLENLVRLPKIKPEIRWHMSKISLQEKLGEPTFRIFESYRNLLNYANFTNKPDDFLTICENQSRLAVQKGFQKYATDMWKDALKRYPQYMQDKHVNFLLELLISRREFSEARTIIDRHYQISLTLSRLMPPKTEDGTQIECQDMSTSSNLDLSINRMETERSCEESTPLADPVDIGLIHVDVLAKIVVAFIYEPNSASEVDYLISTYLILHPSEEIYDLYLEIVDAFRDTGDHARALLILQSVLRLEPVASEVNNWFKFADSQIADNQLDAAAFSLYKAIELAPGLSEPRVRLSVLLHQLGRFDEALSVVTISETDSSIGTSRDY